MAEVIAENGFVPAVFLPMQEASGQLAITEKLETLLTHQIPAFVIRASKRSDAPDDKAVADAQHGDHVYNVRTGIYQLHPRKLVDVSHLRDFKGLGSKKIGQFHTDMSPNFDYFDNTEVEVHTTLRGAGTVFIASPGTRADKLRDGTYRNSDHERDAVHPHNLLLRGLVDPELTSQQIFTTYLRAGDSVVSVGSSRHATMHRYDTDQEAFTPRAVRVSVISESPENVHTFSPDSQTAGEVSAQVLKRTLTLDLPIAS